MLHINARNVNEAFPIALSHFTQMRDLDRLNVVVQRGERRWEMPFPFATTYRYPRERVLFDKTRDANPFFHLMESLWILAARNDVSWLEQWLPRIAGYSDEGSLFHGAYGHRLFAHAQVDKVLERLRRDPGTTRAVLSIYDPEKDADYYGKDMPCNCIVFITIRDGRLDLTVSNRSNDLIWGTYGANVVQFSMLQEYLACNLGVRVGTYTQFSNNTHIYPDNPATRKCLDAYAGVSVDDPYSAASYREHAVVSMPLMVLSGESCIEWDVQLAYFMDGRRVPITDPFFRYVVYPMEDAHRFYREGRVDRALDVVAARMLSNCDWKLAATAWLVRRVKVQPVMMPVGGDDNA